MCFLLSHNYLVLSSTVLALPTERATEYNLTIISKAYYKTLKFISLFYNFLDTNLSYVFILLKQLKFLSQTIASVCIHKKKKLVSIEFCICTHALLIETKARTHVLHLHMS